MSCFQWQDHTADLRVSLEGATFEDLLRCLLDALRDSMLAVVETGPVREVLFSEEVEDEAEALVVLANEAIYRILVQGQVPLAVLWARLEPPKFEALVEFTEAESLELKREIKAATYSGLSIERADGLVRATVLFDV